MSFQFILPDIGEGVVEAEVQKWFVRPGDRVVEDQPLVEVMTDKATVTIPSPRRGRVTRLLWKEGDIAKVHDPLLELDLEDDVAAETPGATPPPGEVSAPATSSVAAAPAFSPTAPSPETPRPVGIEPRSPHRAAAAAAAAAASPEYESVRRSEPRPPNGAVAPARPPAKSLAAPAVRAMARQLGIDIQTVHGTGPGGRVTKQDLAARAQTDGHARERAPAPPGPSARGEALPRAPEGEVEIVPVRGIRRRIAEHMAQAKRTAAHFTFVEQVDVTELVKVKERIAEAAKEEGVKVTFLPFIVKAAVAALKKYPMLNASLDDERGEILVKHWYDIGVASATEQGLVVPVVRHADRRSLLELAREIERLSSDSKAGKLRPADVGSSTFTITSLGTLGGLFATPIINHPEVAILGVHRIRPTPVVRNGQIVARDVMHVSLSFDHRVVDGHVGAAFTYALIRYLEDPNLLFMEMV